MNLTKTKLMTNSEKVDITLDSEALEYVDDYIYLGKLISFRHTNNEDEVDRRIKATWRKFWSLKEILKSNLPISLKKKVMDSCILPCLTYGCQTWKFTKNVRDKIRTCQRAMERSVMKIRKVEKVRHTTIRAKTKFIDALQYALSLKWKWAGHVARLDDGRWTLTATKWPGPPGTRRPGRPYARWCDDIVNVEGKNWLIKARDREAWREKEEAFTL